MFEQFKKPSRESPTSFAHSFWFHVACMIDVEPIANTQVPNGDKCESEGQRPGKFITVVDRSPNGAICDEIQFIFGEKMMPPLQDY